MKTNSNFSNEEIKALEELNIKKFIDLNPSENVFFCFSLERAFEQEIFGDILE